MEKTVETLRMYVTKAMGSADIKALAVAATPDAVKRRAAVIAHDGFAVVDWYASARLYIFGSSIAAALGSAIMAWARRGKGPEAVAAWLVVAAVSSGMAYATRPQSAPVAGAATGDSLAKVNAMLDARANRLDQTEPGWQQRSLARLLG